MKKYEKEELRKLVLAKRSALTEEQRREKSKSILKNILALPEFGSAETIMAYLDFRGEVETTDLASEILSAGKRLVIPLCHMNNLIPCVIKNLDQDIHVGTWGILEPQKDRIRPLPPKEIDLVLVPGVAFDYQGNRLGYGRGYYDRFLPQLKDGILSAGLSFACQIVEKIPTDDYDCKMSLLITESGLIYPE